MSLDVFGTVINSKVDMNIVGQEYSWLSMGCEYLSPMIYPSHYYEGTMGSLYRIKPMTIDSERNWYGKRIWGN